MIRKHYSLTLTLQAPVLSQASGTFKFGMDTAMQRYQGVPALNGSLIRGNVRHALHEFNQHLSGEPQKRLTTLINRWFGQESKNDLEPERALLSFDFVWLPDEKTRQQLQTKTRTRITLDDNGTVKQGHLQVSEDCFPLGTYPVFTGTIHACFAEDDATHHAEQAEFEHWMRKALQSIGAIGSLKGVGYGKVIADASALRQATAPPVQSLNLPDDCDRFELILTLDRPFCIGKPRTNDNNRIVSSDYIPGHVLKGVLAQQTCEATKERLCFDDLHFSHALPTLTTQSRHPCTIPLSLARYTVNNGKEKTRQQCDVAEFANPLADKNWQNTLPDFQPDWKEKDWQAVTHEKAYQTARPQRLLLVRTQIENDKAQPTNQAQEAGLFSVECVDTRDADDNALTWRSTVDLSAITDKQQRTVALKTLLDQLQHGLHTIGKTKANASVRAEAIKTTDLPTAKLPSFATGDRIIVTLHSDARLLPLNLESQLNAEGVKTNNSQEKLTAWYQSYWQQDVFTLEHHYTQQKRSGGVYFHHRYQQGKQYSPEWLTVAGSVFVLTVNHEQRARERIEQWVRRGLPPCDQPDGKQPTWEQSPHLAEHGFGEVTVRLAEDMA